MVRLPRCYPKHDSIRLHQYGSGSKSLSPENHREPIIRDIDPRVSRERRDKHKQQNEWIPGVLFCAWSNTGILILNILLTLIACILASSNASRGYRSQNSTYGVLYHGKCSVSAGWTRGLSILINALSTGMLAASNYCMQCLSAPSRADVDRAHAQRTWLDIGVFSTRNILLRSKRHQILWFLLLTTSIPIHFMYNSATLSSLNMTSYGVILAPVDFGQNDTLTSPTDGGFEFYLNQSPASLRREILEGKLERLTNQECVNKYSVEYLADRGNLVLLVDRESLDGYRSRFAGVGALYDNNEDKFEWMCSGLSGPRSLCTKELVSEAVRAGNWSVYGRPWSDLEWKIHAERPDGTLVTFTHWDTGDILVGIPPDSALAIDVSTLVRYLAANKPKGNHLAIDERQLRGYLHDPANWKNSTWAAHADLELQGAINPAFAWSESKSSPPARVHSCLSQRIDERCELSFSLPICLAVVICNAAKVACMFLTTRQDRREVFLTVGDAMASFLTKPDPYTAGRCMMSKDSVSRGPQRWRHKGRPRFTNPSEGSSISRTRRESTVPNSETRLHSMPRAFPEVLPDRHRWLHGASLRRWRATIGCTLVCLVVSSLLLSAGISSLKNQSRSTSLRSLWNLGFGEPNSATNFLRIYSDIGLAFLTNTPQVILSTMYFLWNNLFTRMLLAVEYNDYASERKALRVSSPEGQQRSSYYLSLPYRYAVSLFATSTLLHWLLSQSLFPVQITKLGAHENPDPDEQFSISKVGYSPIPIILTIACLALAVLVIFALGLRKLNAQMPIAASCSAAISAACHPPDADRDAARKPVMWGEVAGSHPQPATSDGLKTYAHCSFTSEDVKLPSLIRLYS